MNDPTAPVTALWDAFDRRVFDDALPWLSSDFVAEWPQTNERIRGPEAFVRLNEFYPGEWTCEVISIEAIETHRVVAVVRISDGKMSLHAVGFYDLLDGRIEKAVEYFGDDGPPPFDRTRWTEPISPSS